MILQVCVFQTKPNCRQHGLHENSLSPLTCTATDYHHATQEYQHAVNIIFVFRSQYPHTRHKPLLVSTSIHANENVAIDEYTSLPPLQR